MSAIVIFAYPRSSASDFNLAYYTSSHMPMVADKWARYGLRSWSAIEMTPGSPHVVQCVLHWTSVGAFEKALEEDGKDILADIKNYTDVEPAILKGNVKGQWAA
ncbi:hypothetical protein HRG_001690 [Hirsutella rhossiliensis]|uniref:EthD domain-containing protein n=1 Tax=Hirsutella rhossiliensis TaxID=111463 RepID=A0A9P8N5F4_9HYPO|nr:uncharacterized protein HRG_01690 [Hirsutella rhossiliensis]KAH0966281.1 hypothetical protein HRG_01690 [Hirsutella rhossiliensis]